MSDDEYNKKLQSLQQYIPFLNNMITQLKDPRKKNREQQLQKMVSLHSMITDKKKKLKLETLVKCEDVILKLYDKVRSGGSHTPPLGKSRPHSMPPPRLVQYPSSPTTPSSPSPPHGISATKPIVIPMEKVANRGPPQISPVKPTVRSRIDVYGSAAESFRNRSPPQSSRSDIYSTAADSLRNKSPPRRAIDFYSADKSSPPRRASDLYSTAADSLRGPSKRTVFDRLGYHIKPDMSKPPISYEDLEALQADGSPGSRSPETFDADDLSLGQLTDLRKKLQKQLSKPESSSVHGKVPSWEAINTTVRTTSILPKSPVKAPEPTKAPSIDKQPADININTTIRNTTILTKKAVDRSPIRAPESIKTSTGSINIPVIITTTTTLTTKSTEKSPVRPPESTTRSAEAKNPVETAVVSSTILTKKPSDESVVKAPKPIKPLVVDQQKSNKSDNKEKVITETARVQTDTSSKHSESAKIENSKVKMNLLDKDKKIASKEVPVADHSVAKPKVDSAIKPRSDNPTKPKADTAVKPQSSNDNKSENSDSPGKTRLDSSTKPKSDNVNQPKVVTETKSKADDTTKLKSDSETKIKVDSAAKPKSVDTKSDKSNSAAKTKTDSVAKPRSDDAKPKVDSSVKPKNDNSTRADNSDSVKKPKADSSSKSKVEDIPKSKNDSVTKPKIDSATRTKVDSSAKPKVEGSSKPKNENVKVLKEVDCMFSSTLSSIDSKLLDKKKDKKEERRSSVDSRSESSSKDKSKEKHERRSSSDEKKSDSSSSSSSNKSKEKSEKVSDHKRHGSSHHHRTKDIDKKDDKEGMKSKSDQATASDTKNDKGVSKHETNENKSEGTISKQVETKAGEGNCQSKGKDINKKVGIETNEKSDKKLDIEKLCFKLPQTKKTDDDRGSVNDKSEPVKEEKKTTIVDKPVAEETNVEKPQVYKRLADKYNPKPRKPSIEGTEVKPNPLVKPGLVPQILPTPVPQMSPLVKIPFLDNTISTQSSMSSLSKIPSLLSLPVPSQSPSVSFQQQPQTPRPPLLSPTSSVNSIDNEFDFNKKVDFISPQVSSILANPTTSAIINTVISQFKGKSGLLPTPESGGIQNFARDCSSFVPNQQFGAYLPNFIPDHHQNKLQTPSIQLNMQQNIHYSQPTMSNTNNYQLQQQQQQQRNLMSPMPYGGAPNQSPMGNNMMQPQRGRPFAPFDPIDEPPPTPINHFDNDATFYPNRAMTPTPFCNQGMMNPSITPQHQEPAQNFPDHRYPPSLGNELLFGHQDKDMRPFEYANPRQTMQRSYDARDQSWAPRDQPRDPREQMRDPREQMRDPREQSRDPRELLRDPREQSRDTRELPRDPRDNSRDSRELSRDYRERDPRYRTRDPRTLNRERDSYSSTFRERDDHNRSSSSYRETRDYDRDSHDLDRDTRDRDTRDRDSRDRDSRSRHREVRDPRLNRPSDSRYERSYSRPRSRSRSRVDNSFGSPLGSLYTGNDGSKKTGKGYGVQSFKIPRIKKDEEEANAEEKSDDKVEDKPAKQEEKPAKAEEKPAKAEEKPAKTEEKPAKVEEKPAKAEEKPAVDTVGKDDSKKLEVAVAAQEESAKVSSSSSESKDNELPKAESTKETETTEISSSTNNDTLPEEEKVTEKPSSETDIINQFLKTLLQNDKTRAAASMFINELSESANDDRLKAIVQTVKTVGKGENGKTEEVSEELKSGKVGEKINEEVTDKEKGDDNDKDDSESAEVNSVLKKTIKKRKFKKQKKKGKPVAKASAPVESPCVEESPDKPEEAEERQVVQNEQTVQTKPREETPGEEVVVTVGERIKNRRRQAATGGKPKKCKTELDMLHEDIKDMFIRDGVLTATGKRMCCLLKDESATTNKNPAPAKKVAEPATRIKKGSGKSEKFDATSSANSDKLKAMSNVRVLLPKIPVSKMNTSSDSNTDDSKRYSLREGRSTRNYAENDSDDESVLKRVLRTKPQQQEQQPHSEDEKAEDESDNDHELENDKASEEDHSESDHTEPESVAEPLAPRIPPKKGKVGHRKRFSSWASGIIPKKKKTEKHRAGDETSADPPVPEKSSGNPSTLETSTAAMVISTPPGTEPEQTNIEDSGPEFIEPDKNYYVKPRVIKMKCKLCKFYGKGISSHYRFEHPDCEVLSSRLHPKVAEQLIQESIDEKLDELTDLSTNPSKRFSYKCPFCGLNLKYADMTRFHDHITLHTGEFRHNCNICQFGFTTYKSLREHCKNKHNVDRRNDVPRIATEVFGYICSECNFLQLDKKTVENHANIYHLDDGKKIYRVRLDTPIEPTIHSGSPETDTPDQMSTADDTIVNTEGEDEEEEEKQASSVSNKRPLENSEPDHSESDVAQPAAKKKASKEQVNQVEETEEPESLPTASPPPALPSTPPPPLSSTPPPPQLPPASSPVVKKEKEIDMTVFECNTDLQKEEEKIEQERLKTMAELNETVKTHRQSLNFVDELSNRLKNEQQQLQSPQIAQIKTEPVAHEPDEEVLEPEADPKRVVYDKIADMAPKKTPKFPESPLVSAPATTEVVQKDTSMITDMIQKLRGILNDDISSQDNTSLNNLSNLDDSSDVRPGSSTSMVPSPGDTHADESMGDSVPDAEEVQKSPEEVDETKTLVISANLLDVVKQDSRIEYKCKMSNCTYVTASRTELLQHWPNDHPSLAQWYRYNNTKCQVCELKIIASEGDDLLTIYVDHMENKHATSSDNNLSIAVVGPPPLQPFERLNQETQTILAAGFLNIIKDKGQLEYACKVPSCMYATSERDKFVSHWEEDHKLFQMNFKFTRCRLCHTQVAASENSNGKLLMAFFEHVETQHVSETGPLRRVMLRTRRLSGDKLSKTNPDEDQPDENKSEEITPDDGGNSSSSTTNEISHTTEISIDLEDNPFPFKIAGVVSLAADGKVKVPPLSPISDKAKTDMSSSTGSPVKTTITTAPGKNVTSVVLKEVEMTAAERFRPWKSARSYEVFLRATNDLYKCPAFDCSFSTSKRSLFKRHLTIGHHYTSDIMVACVYCWMKTPLSQADIHIYVRHSKSSYSCSECLYRAVCKEYVMAHLKAQHQGKNIVVMLKELVSLAQPLPRKYSAADNCPPFVCGGLGCQRRFLYEKDFLAHVQVCNGALNQCAHRSFLCTYQCFIASSMISHWQTHGCFPYHCLYCKSTFVKKTQVLDHFSKFHQHVLPEVVDRTNKPTTDTSIEDYDIAIKNVKCINRSILDGVERKNFRFIYAPEDAEAERFLKPTPKVTERNIGALLSKTPKILPKTDTPSVIPVLSPSTSSAAVATPKPKMNIISVSKSDIVAAAAVPSPSSPSPKAVYQKPKMFAKSKLVEKTAVASGAGLLPMSIVQGSDKKFYAIISRSVNQTKCPPTPPPPPPPTRKEIITYPSPAQKNVVASTFAGMEVADVTAGSDAIMTANFSTVTANASEVTANVSEMTADASDNVTADAATASMTDIVTDANTDGVVLAVMANPDGGTPQVISGPDFAFAEVQKAPEVAPEMMDTTTPIIPVASTSGATPASSSSSSSLPSTAIIAPTTSSVPPSNSNDGNQDNNSGAAAADLDDNHYDGSSNDADDSFEPLIIDESMPQEKTNDADMSASDPLSLEDNDAIADDVRRQEQEGAEKDGEQQESEAEKERQQEQEQQEQELQQQEMTAPSPASGVQASGDESDSQDLLNGGSGATHTPFGLIGYQLFRCAVCDSSFSNARSFKVHCNESHECQDMTNYAKPYRCAHCSRRFKNPHGLLEHVLYHGQLRFKCSLCVRKFPSAFALRVHMRLRHCVHHTTIVPVIPNKTNLDTDEFILRPKPMDEPPETQEPPQEKEKSTEQKTEFLPDEIDLLPQRHIFNFTVKCALCSYTTKVRTNLLRHLQFHSKEKSVPDIAPVNPVPCLDKNEKMFDKMTNLAISSFSGANTGRMGGGHKADQKTEENVEYPNYVPSNRRYACCASGCNYICPEESNLRHHLLALHETEPHFMCVHCKFDQITDVDVYLKHLKMHDLHLYKCNYCEFVHNLRHKIERHSGDKHPDLPVKVVTVRALDAELPDASPLGEAGQHSATAVDTANQEPKPSTSDYGVTTAASSVDSAAQAQQQQQGAQVKYTKPWQCGMCKYRFTTKDDILVHIQNKHDLDSQYKCTLCSYKSDEKEVFFPHFKHCHPGHDTNIIHVYYKSEYLRSNSTAGGASAGAVNSEQGLDKAFDTTPLWQRDRPRIRHIRGILLDESSSSVLKSSPKNKPIWNTKAAANMGVDSIDSAIEAVVKGVDKTSKSQTRVSDEIFNMLNEQIKEVDIAGSATAQDRDPLAVENETTKNKEIPLGASTSSSTAGTSVTTDADKQSDNAVIILDSDEEELEQQKQSGKNKDKDKKNDNSEQPTEENETDDESFIPMSSFEAQKDLENDQSDSEDCGNLVIDCGSMEEVLPTFAVARKARPNSKDQQQLLQKDDASGSTAGRTVLTEDMLQAMYSRLVAPAGKSYRCPMCLKGKTKRLSNLVHHILTEMNRTRYTCHVCDHKTITHYSMCSHYKEHHAKMSVTQIIETPLEEPLIWWLQMLIQYQSRLLCQIQDAPIQSETKGGFFTTSCRFCKKWFHNKLVVKEHEIHHWAYTSYTCGHCLIDSPSMEKFFEHSSTIHPRRNYFLKINGPSVNQILSKLRDRTGNASSDREDNDQIAMKKFFCFYCLETTTSMAELHSHWKRSHENENVQFKYRSEAQLSLATDTTAAEVIQQQQPARTPQIRHKMDRNETVYCCSYCHKKDTFSRLEAHHSAEHPLTVFHVYNVICMECPDTFENLKDMRMHFAKCHPGKRLSYSPIDNRLESGGEVYQCTQCVFRCTTLGSIRYHVRKHVKPVECKLCGESFPSRFEGKQHHKKTHKGGTENVGMSKAKMKEYRKILDQILGTKEPEEIFDISMEDDSDDVIAIDVETVDPPPPSTGRFTGATYSAAANLAASLSLAITPSTSPIIEDVVTAVNTTSDDEDDMLVLKEVQVTKSRSARRSAAAAGLPTTPQGVTTVKRRKVARKSTAKNSRNDDVIQPEYSFYNANKEPRPSDFKGITTSIEVNKIHTKITVEQFSSIFNIFPRLQLDDCGKNLPSNRDLQQDDNNETALTTTISQSAIGDAML